MPQRASDLELALRYELGCEGYDELYGEEQLDKYVSALRLMPPHGRVLDVGCGTGLLVEFMSSGGLINSVSAYFCVDISSCMTLKAKERAARACGDKCVVLQGDAYRLPFKDESFDVVYSFSLINLLERPAEALAEISRVARAALVTAVGPLGPLTDLPPGWIPIGPVGRDYGYVYRAL